MAVLWLDAHLSSSLLAVLSVQHVYGRAHTRSQRKRGKTPQRERVKKRENERREITGGRTDRRTGRKQLVHSHHVLTYRHSVTDGQCSWQKYTQAGWDKQRSFCCKIIWHDFKAALISVFVSVSPAVSEIIAVLPLKNTLFYSKQQEKI